MRSPSTSKMQARKGGNSVVSFAVAEDMIPAEFCSSRSFVHGIDRDLGRVQQNAG